jgi:hypothetical protein
MYWNTGAFLERLFTPLLFVFGSVTTVLSAPQVAPTVPDTTAMTAAKWAQFQKLSWCFSVLVMFLVALLCAFLFGFFPVLFLIQQAYGFRTRKKHERRKEKGWHIFN